MIRLLFPFLAVWKGLPSVPFAHLYGARPERASLLLAFLLNLSPLRCAVRAGQLIICAAWAGQFVICPICLICGAPRSVWKAIHGRRDALLFYPKWSRTPSPRCPRPPTVHALRTKLNACKRVEIQTWPHRWVSMIAKHVSMTPVLRGQLLGVHPCLPVHLFLVVKGNTVPRRIRADMDIQECIQDFNNTWLHALLTKKQQASAEI